MVNTKTPKNIQVSVSSGRFKIKQKQDMSAFVLKLFTNYILLSFCLFSEL